MCLGFESVSGLRVLVVGFRVQGWFKACKSLGFKVRVLSRFGFKTNGLGFAKPSRDL